MSSPKPIIATMNNVSEPECDKKPISLPGVG